MRRSLLALIFLFAASAFAQADAGRKPRFAVLYFDPLSGKPEMQVFAKGLAALLIADFASNTDLYVLERERLEDALTELKLGETRFADKSSFGKVGKVLGVDYLLVGSLVDPGAQKAIAVRLIQFPEMRDVGGVKVMLNDDNVFAGEEEVVRKVTDQLKKLGAVSNDSAPGKTGKLPSTTMQTYAKALDAKDKKDKATATRLLGEVVKAQPDFKLAALDLLALTK